MILRLPKRPEVSISVKIGFESRLQSRSVLNALIPDNVNFPEGLFLDMFTSGSTLTIIVRGSDIPLVTVLSTVDEVLEHASICQKVISR